MGADGVLGGDLVDVGTPFAGRDKVVHLVLGGVAFRLALRWVAPWTWAEWSAAPWLVGLWALGLVLLVAILTELVEEARYVRGYVYLADEADGTDVLVTVAGGLLAWGVL